MKTAICFSGHLRTFFEVFHSVKDNIIDPLNADVFIHTWEVIGSPTNKTQADNDLRSTLCDQQKVIDLAQPKKIAFESDKILESFIKDSDDIILPEEQRKFVMTHIGYHVSMFYGIYQSNQLKCKYEIENNFKYDRVIRIRPDLFWETKLVHSMFPNNDILYIPEIAQFCDEGMNDQVCIGSSSNMDIYSGIYHDIISYYRNNVTTARPEALFKYHINKHQITTQALDLNYKMYRLDGNIFTMYKMHGDHISRWK